jgi:nitrous oxidase accessory protein NosD
LRTGGAAVADLFGMQPNNLFPVTNATVALGGTSNSWTGLFLASTATINFASSNVVLTHSTGLLSVTTGDFQANLPLSTETTGTLTVASANKHILATGGITLPNSVFAARNITTIDGNGTSRTITRGSGVTMYVNGTDSATATLTSNGLMAVYWRTASICILKGDVS